MRVKSQSGFVFTETATVLLTPSTQSTTPCIPQKKDADGETGGSERCIYSVQYEDRKRPGKTPGDIQDLYKFIQ